MRNTLSRIRTTCWGGGVLTAGQRRWRPGTSFEGGGIGAAQAITAVGRGRETTHRSGRWPHTAKWKIPRQPGPWGTRLNRVCENILAWMCHPDPRRGRPPCLPISLKAIGRWAWRTRATTGQGNHRGLPLQVRTALCGPNGHCPKICTDTLNLPCLVSSCVLPTRSVDKENVPRPLVRPVPKRPGLSRWTIAQRLHLKGTCPC